MTGSELLAYVKKVFKREDKDTEIYECMTDIVVDMRLRLLNSDDYSTMSSDLGGSLSDGASTVGLPSDFGHLVVDGVLIRDTTSDDTYRPLIKISKGRYDELYHEVYSNTVANRHTGVPLHYAYYGRQLYLGPAVDGSNYEIKINYTTDGVADITSGTDPVPFTDKYRRIVRDGVCMLMYRQLENFGEADIFEREYDRGIRKIMENDDFNMSDNAPMAYNGC